MEPQTKTFSTATRCNFKVCVLGASGGVGQPLSLLLQMNPLCTHLTLHDVTMGTRGLAADLSHINTKCCCEGLGPGKLIKAVTGAHIILVAVSGQSKRKDKEDIFNLNACILYEIAITVACVNPCALVVVMTDPLNAMVPVFSEVMSRMGKYDENKIFGVTAIDCMRAATFVSECNHSEPSRQHVPVVGGHAGLTIVPLLSLSTPPVELDDWQRELIIKNLQAVEQEVMLAKAGAAGPGATLSAASAAATFIDSLLRGLSGERGIVECTYVRSRNTPASFFSTPVLLGQRGIELNFGLSSYATQHEQILIDNAASKLQSDIRQGLDCRSEMETSVLQKFQP